MKAVPKKTAVICWLRWPPMPSGPRPPVSYAGTYIGPENIIKNVHQRLGSEWQGYRADVDHFYDAGDNVIAQGFYHGTYRATGKSFSASFAHIYTLRAGKIVKFVQIVDSAKVLEAMQP